MSPKTLIAIVILVVSGLAQAQDQLLQPSDGIGQVPVAVVDSRPGEQRNGKVLSTAIWNCAFSIRRIGDFETAPPRLDRLKVVLTENFPELRGQAVSVNNYTMHLNSAAFARKGFSRSSSGAIAAGMNAPVVGCASEDLQGGYTPGEISLKNSPIITVIDLVVGGREFHFRSISDTDLRFFHKREDNLRNFGNAASKAMNELVPKLRDFLAEK